PLHIGHQLLGGIVLVQHAVHPEGHRQLGKQAVVGFHHIVLHVAGDVDAGDLVSVPLRKCQNVRLGLVLGDGKGGVDIYLVGSGDFVQHHLEGLQVGE
ncbi:CRISPR-associated endonuclease Cas2, partial [Dysosmobacter welbionis]